MAGRKPVVEAAVPEVVAEPIVETEVPEVVIEPTEDEVSDVEIDPELDIDEIDIPAEIPFQAYACALTALSRQHSEWHGYVASMLAARTVKLSVPIVGGGHVQYVLSFPEMVAVELVPMEG